MKRINHRNKPSKNNRNQHGADIAKKSDQIRRIDTDWYQVKSQCIADTWYDVHSTEFGLKCTCPDHTWHNVKCKHIIACEISLKIRRIVKTHASINPINAQNCPYCQSDDFVKRGIRKNKNGSIQRYMCKSCNRKFSINLGFERMHASPQVITSAMQLYFTGESYRNIQKFLKLQGMEFTHMSIYNWVKRYTSLMDKYLKTVTPNVGDKWHADEVWIKIAGNRKFLFAMMDNDTRFWLSREVADTKFRHDAQSLLKMGKNVAKKTPLEFVTDGLPAYNKAFRREFGKWRKPVPKHTREIHIKNQVANNNIQERLNGEIRDREKTFRGLKKDNSVAITGIQMYHNYFRSHMSLNGDTPALRAGIKITGKNPMITVIQNAVKSPDTLQSGDDL